MPHQRRIAQITMLLFLGIFERYFIVSFVASIWAFSPGGGDSCISIRLERIFWNPMSCGLKHFVVFPRTTFSSEHHVFMEDSDLLSYRNSQRGVLCATIPSTLNFKQIKIGDQKRFIKLLVIHADRVKNRPKGQKVISWNSLALVAYDLNDKKQNLPIRAFTEHKNVGGGDLMEIPNDISHCLDQVGITVNKNKLREGAGGPTPGVARPFPFTYHTVSVLLFSLLLCRRLTFYVSCTHAASEPFMSFSNSAA